MKNRVVTVDHEACWGCKTCEVACKQEMKAPDGVKLISVVEEWPRSPEGKLSFRYHVGMCRHCEEPPCAEACPERVISKSAYDMSRGIAQKCNLCHHRVDKGLLPACADNVCLAHCISFSESA